MLEVRAAWGLDGKWLLLLLLLLLDLLRSKSEAQKDGHVAYLEESHVGCLSISHSFLGRLLGWSKFV